jgi:hypothetical protein
MVSTFLADYEEKSIINLQNESSLFLFEKQVGLKKYHKMVVSKNDNVILKYNGKGKSYFTLPSSNVLMAGRYYIFLEQEINPETDRMARTAKITAIDFERNYTIDEFIKINGEQGEEYLGIDVDRSGNYVLLPYLQDDPEFPLLRIYDHAKGKLHKIDTDQLIDYHFERMRWKRSIDLIIFYNFISGKDEEVILDWDRKRIVIQDN